MSFVEFAQQRRGRYRNDAFINFTEGSRKSSAMPSSGRSRRGSRPRRSRRAMAAHGCYVYGSKAYGRRLSAAAFRRKIVDYNSTSNVFRLSAIDQTAGLIQHQLLNGRGFYTMRNAQTAPGAQLEWPVYAFDLTSVPNQYNGVYTYPRTAWKAYSGSEASGAAINWQSVAAPPNTTSSFQPEACGIEPSPGERSLLNWVDAKIMFFAPYKIPVRINIDIVQFKHDEVCPGGTYGESPKTITQPNDVAFWESMMKKYMISPLESGNDRLERKYITYLHRDSFILDCKTSIENEVTHYKQYDLFKRMNRKCTYKWLDPGTMKMNMQAPGTGGVDWIQNAASPNYWTVHPKARTFLLIRAFAGQVQNSNVYNADYHPSFDLVLRTKHSSLQA